MTRIVLFAALVVSGCDGIPPLPDRDSPVLAEVAKTAATPVRGENTSDAAFPWLRDFTDEEDEALQVSANAIEVEGETFVIVSRSYTTSDRECGPSYDPSTVCMWWSEIVVVHDLDGSPTEVGHLQHSFGGVDASPVRRARNAGR